MGLAIALAGKSISQQFCWISLAWREEKCVSLEWLRKCLSCKCKFIFTRGLYKFRKFQTYIFLSFFFVCVRQWMVFSKWLQLTWLQNICNQNCSDELCQLLKTLSLEKRIPIYVRYVTTSELNAPSVLIHLLKHYR